ncbi:hypothetical protein [Dongia deserti]|uniref:hypothetical protein n=1 Tax=Dongia deserti TaxID=2268030 RepID=UPI000E65922F|nr:hypothetical protein [Dongia deserti]
MISFLEHPDAFVRLLIGVGRAIRSSDEESARPWAYDDPLPLIEIGRRLRHPDAMAVTRQASPAPSGSVLD